MPRTPSDDKRKSKDKIYYNEDAKNGKPYWFQVMVDGKRITKRGFRTLTEAKRAREALSTDLHKGEYIDQSKIPYGEYFMDWVNRRAEGGNIAPSTAELYTSYFNIHIDKGLGKIRLSNLTPTDILNFITTLRKKSLSDEGVKRIYSVIRASLNSAVTLDILPKNVALKIPKEEKPTVEHKERQIWNNDSIKILLEKGRHGTTRYWIAVFLAVMTGMRQGEILGLRWSDIDFEKSVLHVRRSMKKDKEVTSKLKTAGSKRTIALSPLTIDVLLEHRQFLEDEREERIAAGKDYFDTEHVVCNSQGKPTRASKILDAWYRLCNKYKPEHEPDITFHDLRHQSASIMLNEREDVRVVSKRLGHSTIHTTMKVYSHLLPNAQESAALSLDKAVGFNNDDKDQSTTYLQ